MRIEITRFDGKTRVLQGAEAAALVTCLGYGASAIEGDMTWQQDWMADRARDGKALERWLFPEADMHRIIDDSQARKVDGAEHQFLAHRTCGPMPHGIPDDYE